MGNRDNSVDHESRGIRLFELFAFFWSWGGATRDLSHPAARVLIELAGISTKEGTRSLPHGQLTGWDQGNGDIDSLCPATHSEMMD